MPNWRVAHSWVRLLDLLHIDGTQPIGGRILAKLQGSNIGDNSPAICRVETVGIAMHHPVALGDDVEKIPRRRLAQCLRMKGRGQREIVPGDDSLPAACAPVAGRAEDIKSLLPAVKRKGRRGSVRYAASVASGVAPG